VDWRDIEGETPEQDIELLIELVQSLPDDAVVVELGTNRGRSGLAMASAGGGVVYLVDNFTPDHPGWVAPSREVLEQNIAAIGLQERCVVVEGDSAETGRDWQGGKVGLLFIDAAHDEGSVRADIEAWLPHVEGYVCLHDFNNPHVPGVQAAARALLGEPWKVHWLTGVYCV